MTLLLGKLEIEAEFERIEKRLIEHNQNTIKNGLQKANIRVHQQRMIRRNEDKRRIKSLSKATEIGLASVAKCTQM